jgi:heptosyltransferase III
VRRLLIRPGAIGDIILSLPTLEAARADYTEVWAPRPVLPLLRFADQTRAIIDTGIERVGVVTGARVTALETFDSIYSWYGTKHLEFRDAVKGLPFEFFPALPPGPGMPRIAVPAIAASNHVVVHPFASSTSKRWPLDLFQKLAANLPQPVRWLAGPEERLDGAHRIDDLYELACWLGDARLYIGNDSGISHLAAAVGVPTLAIFLASDPQVWAPRGDHARVLVRPTLDEALAAVHSILG